MGCSDVHKLGELHDRHSGPVFGYLLGLSGDPALADELTGETFYRAMLALDGFRGDASVKTWLLRIARNLYLRRAQREGAPARWRRWRSGAGPSPPRRRPTRR